LKFLKQLFNVKINNQEGIKMKTKIRRNNKVMKNVLFTAAIFFSVLMLSLVFSDNKTEKTVRMPVHETLSESNSSESSVFLNANTDYSQLNEYLIEIEEPELTISNMPEIHFPKISNEIADEHPGKNEYLVALGEQKIQELTEYYNLVLKTKKLLVLETEEELELEDWMVDDGCWCIESTPTLMAKKEN